jgi:hypothetical protein
MQRLADKPTSKEQLRAKERRQKVLDMRLLGASLRRIADKIGCSHETARLDLQKALAELNELEKAKTDHLRSLELQRLDVAMNAIANKVLEGDCGAIDRWLKVSERRSRLLGLDAPEKSNISVTGSALTEMSNDELRRIVAARQVAQSGDDGAAAGAGDDDD